MEQIIDISVKQGFEMAFVMLHKNTGKTLGWFICLGEREI